MATHSFPIISMLVSFPIFPDSYIVLGKILEKSQSKWLEKHSNTYFSYIAAQGPGEETSALFWEMIWQQNVRIVVMLTNLIEGLGFHSTKCSQYWPELVGNTRRFGGSSPDSQIEVQLYDCQEAPDYLVRKLDISKGDSTRTLVHVQCTSWPDRSAPKNASTLLQLVEVVRMLASQYNQQSGHQMVEAAPWLIHCSAGVGRTGNVYNFVTF